MTSYYKSPRAAGMLGFSVDTLKRLREIKGGFLQHGIHYRSGLHKNTPLTWNVELIAEELSQRGREQLIEREGQKIIENQK